MQLRNNLKYAFDCLQMLTADLCMISYMLQCNDIWLLRQVFGIIIGRLRCRIQARYKQIFTLYSVVIFRIIILTKFTFRKFSRNPYTSKIKNEIFRSGGSEHSCMCVYVYVYIRVLACVRVCMCVRACLCLRACVCVFIFVCL